MTVSYTIQSGDTLTKIVQEHYGLTGADAHKKALEVAKQNNIENANLIYAGNDLQLFGLDDEVEEADGDTFQKQNEVGEEKSLFEQLLEKQQKYQRNQAIEAANSVLDDKYKLENTSGYDKEVDGRIQFAEIDGNSKTKVEDYKKAALMLAQEDIAAGDTVKQDGLLDLKEFTQIQKARYAETFSAIDQQRDKNIYRQVNNLAINAEVPQDSLEDYSQIDMDNIFEQLFNNYDMDNNGFLDQQEIAATYIAMDSVLKDGGSKNTIRAMSDKNEVLQTFDGIIDFAEADAVSAYYLDNPKEYEKLYNMFFSNSAA